MYVGTVPAKLHLNHSYVHCFVHTQKNCYKKSYKINEDISLQYRAPGLQHYIYVYHTYVSSMNVNCNLHLDNTGTSHIRTWVRSDAIIPQKYSNIKPQRYLCNIIQKRLFIRIDFHLIDLHWTQFFTFSLHIQCTYNRGKPDRALREDLTHSTVLC